MRILLLALLGGCVMDEATSPPVIGTSADVTTQAGTYVGFRIDTSCASHAADLGVIGTGSVAITDVADIASAGQDLRTKLSDITSIWGYGGYGLVCESGVGTEIDLSDWRDVDAVLARTGAWLHEHDYALQVGITVGSIPVAD
jgi:hypothetical protein